MNHHQTFAHIPAESGLLFLLLAALLVAAYVLTGSHSTGGAE